MRVLAERHPLIEKVESLSDGELGRMSDQELVQRLGASFDEFYYAHDAVGTIGRRLAGIYAGARKVCIGDAFGMIYTPESLPAPRASLRTFARKLATALALRRATGPIRPDVAALVLPVDVSGKGLASVELVCCRKEDFVEAIDACHANASALRDYLDGLLRRYQARKRYLLLTENYVEAGHATARNEIAMYCEIIRHHCEPGSVVLLKPHPLESPGKDALIRARLGTDYEIVPTERRFARYPIELWREAVLGCTVICTAYPVLSLKYAHGIDVVQPMNDTLIERWIEPEHRKWSRDSLRLYMEPLGRLASWDACSVLWSGGKPS